MRKGWVVATAVAVLGLLAVVPATRARAAGPTFSDAAGIHVVSSSSIDSRQYNVQVSTPALGRTVDVRILVPSGYDTSAARYPVLYLFHGTSGRASDWVKLGDAEAATAGVGLITVMPDAGFNGDGGGWFTNWYDTKTKEGPSQWETFHVNQLIPWVDANLRTITSRNGRAVAGLSQGGFGSMTYAARHPDTFSSVASFSGAPDIDYNPVTALGASAIIEATAVGLDGVEPDAMFGPRATNEINWQGHDPADLVTNLNGVDVSLWTANGLPGPLDPPTPNPGAGGIEAATHGSTVSFEQRASMQSVPIHVNDYGNGTHTWPYWARDLKQYLPQMMATFANPPVPLWTSYQSIDQSWSQWGWSVSVQRSAAQQFSSLIDASADSFMLSGAGTATVVTPAFYPPGAVEHVTISPTTGITRTTATADGAGRLHLTVPLGPDVPPPLGSAAVIGVPGVPPWPPTMVTISAA